MSLGSSGGNLKKMLRDNPPPSGPPAGVRLEQRIGIRAPAPKIWSILVDFDHWPRWADIYSEVRGSFLYGGRITLQQSLPGMPPRTIDAKIIDWEPEAQIVWRDKVQLGVWTTRYLEVTPLSDTGCIFTNGEIFSGPLARWWLSLRGAALQQALSRQTEQMKTLAEQ